MSGRRLWGGRGTGYIEAIDEVAKTLRLWVRRKHGNRELVRSCCGRRVGEMVAAYEREVRDLPCFEYRTRLVIELYRVRCPDCGIKHEKVEQPLSKAPFSKRFEEAIGEACESAPVRRVCADLGCRPRHRSALLDALGGRAQEARIAADRHR